MASLDPVVRSKLSVSQLREILRIQIHKPDVDVNLLSRIIVEEVFDRGLVVPELLRAAEMIGPFAVDAGKKIWHYDKGVWKPNGIDELALRVALCTGPRYRKEHVQQVASLITARNPQIEGLGPTKLMNVKNGMLDWQTRELHPHDPKYFSTYQLTMNWNPVAKCPSMDEWVNNVFGDELDALAWQIIGVVWHPRMGVQKAITLIGDGFNGKGTFLRLCKAGLPNHAVSSIDPKKLAENRFSSAELFGKTANIVGDIEKLSISSTAEFKKITGEDPLNAERKMGHPFTFISQATNLFAGNKMPTSRDTSHGWYRRWLIVPLDKRIESRPDPELESRLQSELEGVLVRAVEGLNQVVERGGFDEPESIRQAAQEYEYACNPSALFIHENLEFAREHEAPIPRRELYSAYQEFCVNSGLKADSRSKFYEMLETLGVPHLRNHWVTNLQGDSERGYAGVLVTGGPKVR